MATGFVQRWKGKVAPKLIFLGVGATVVAQSSITNALSTIRGTDLAGLAGVGSAALASTLTQMPNNGVSYIQASSAKAIYPLAAPVPGAEKTIAILQNSSAVVIQVSTSGALGVVLDPSSNTNLLSTVTGQISLMGVSTTRWAISAFYGSTAAVLTASTSS